MDVMSPAPEDKLNGCRGIVKGMAISLLLWIGVILLLLWWWFKA